MTVMTLTHHFERYEELAKKCTMWVEKVKQIWETTPFFVGKVAGDAMPSYLGDGKTATKNFELALESSALAAAKLKLGAEILIKHICMEA